MNGRAWTTADERVLREMAKTHPDEQIALRLGRSAAAVCKRRQDLHIKGHREWTAEKQEALRKMHAAGHSIANIAKAMGRSWWSIENQLRRLEVPHTTSAAPGAKYVRRDTAQRIDKLMELVERCA